MASRNGFWLLLVSLVLLSSLSAGKKTRKCGSQLVNQLQGVCRQVVGLLADRKDLPRLTLCAGPNIMEEMVERIGDPNDIQVVYRWPSPNSRCSGVSDALFRESAGCDLNAAWMFYVMTGHAWGLSIATCRQGQLPLNANGRVTIPGASPTIVLNELRRVILENQPRAFHFVENGITEPFHHWVVLQTPDATGQTSTFRVMTAFANTWRVVDWLKKNTQLPIPSYAGSEMSLDAFENYFLRELQTLLVEFNRNGGMTQETEEIYKKLWGVEGWKKNGDGRASVTIRYAPATDDTCTQYSQIFMRTQGLDGTLRGAQTARNFPTRSAASANIAACLENSDCKKNYDKYNCEADQW